MSDKPVVPSDDEYQRGENAEAELQQFVAKRETARKSNGEPRSIQKLHETSKQAYDVAKKREARAAWATYHREQAARHHANLSRLIRWHESEAARYEEGAA